MRSSTALLLSCIVCSGFSVARLSAQTSQPNLPGAPASDVSNIPKDITDTFDRVATRRRLNSGVPKQDTSRTPEARLLPPLTFVTAPTVAAQQLQIPAKARKEYQQACAALNKQKSQEAEEHLRKAVDIDAKYAIAWVTLGQVLTGQHRSAEGRSACLQASTVDSSYVPAYLCLAEIAARAHVWDEVVKLSSRALERDPANDAVAYEYYAAGNYHLHNLGKAEKSALHAVAIDKDHREPRVYFVLAQIYQAQGDSAKEAAQLREYLRYVKNAVDVAAIQQYLSKLEQPGRPKADDSQTQEPLTGALRSPKQEWGPADIDEVVPPARTDIPCPLAQILKETSSRTQHFIDTLRFSATERIEQISIDKKGNSRNASTQEANYVAEVQENASGFPAVTEYRYGSGGARQPSLMDSGTAAFALIFHRSHLDNFDFRCEGLAGPATSSAWQVHFEEKDNSAKPFQAIWVGHTLYLPRFKGRAWISTDTYDVLRIETDLVSRFHRSICSSSIWSSAMLRWNSTTTSLGSGYRRALLCICPIADIVTSACTLSASSSFSRWIPLKRLNSRQLRTISC